MILSIEKVKVVPAATILLKNPLKKYSVPLNTADEAEFMRALLVNGLIITADVFDGVYPLKVSCRDPPAGI